LALDRIEQIEQIIGEQLGDNAVLPRPPGFPPRQ
jgi:hypothetical protein